jgi:hypothetical protein
MPPTVLVAIASVSRLGTYRADIEAAKMAGLQFDLSAMALDRAGRVTAVRLPRVGRPRHGSSIFREADKFRKKRTDFPCAFCRRIHWLGGRDRRNDPGDARRWEGQKLIL